MMFIPRPVIPPRNPDVEPFYYSCESVSDFGKAEEFLPMLSNYAKNHGLDFKYHYDEHFKGWHYVFENPMTGYKWTYYVSLRIEQDCLMLPGLFAEKIISKIPKELF